MLVCGVEITTHEANICLVGHTNGMLNVPDCRQRVFTLPKSGSTEAVRAFHFSFQKLMQDYKVDEVVIIERPQKGKLAGTALGFKLETAIQLIEQTVTVLHHSVIKAQLKRNPMQIDFDSLGLKKFQKQALNVAYAYHQNLLHPIAEEE